MNFPQIAQQVIDKLGGKENIATAAHCATRLRIVLNDETKVDKEGIDNIEGVKGQFAVARMPGKHPRFVILGWRCFDH